MGAWCGSTSAPKCTWRGGGRRWCGVPAILDAISRPDVREEDPAPGRERFYRAISTHGEWLRVVVDFNESPAFVVTAFVQDHPPEGHQ